MSTNSRFFLKEGYVENINTSSYDPDFNSTQAFWTPQRLATASYYQFHVYKFAARLAQSNSLKNISDVGCGPAVKTSMFFGNSNYSVNLFDQESCRGICQEQMPGATFHPVNLESPLIPSTQESSDLVICSDVLEHLIDPTNCIELCKRLVRKTGYIIFSTPERDNLRGKECMKSGHPQHIREWNRSEFIRLLEHNGLSIVKSKLLPQHSLSPSEIIKYRMSFGMHRRSKYRSCNLVLCRI